MAAVAASGGHANQHHHRIERLCGELAEAYDPSHGLGSMTCNPYDTAWVAIVSKDVAGRPCYLYPSCFEYLLDSQLPSGGWSTTSSKAEGDVGVSEILSSLAALFALHRISHEPCQFDEAKVAKARKAVDAAVAYLSGNLSKWDVKKSREVGFEYLVPSLLELVEEQGFTFSFARKNDLYDIRQQKLSKLRYESLYGSKKSAFLHSAEVFFGDPKFSFDSIKHHKVHGSIMASPSATAAYLMRISDWDDEAEAYLRHVMDFGAGKGSGGMPSAFPTTYFELTWVVSTLISAGLSRESIQSGRIRELYSIIRDVASHNNGLVGFASGIEPDLDDTAQASIIFSKLGETGLSKPMEEYFARPGHFQTYKGERHASFSANCNALYAILLDDSRETAASTIRGIIDFLCKTWWEADMSPQDKWSFSPFYSYMLISRTFMSLLENLDKGKLEAPVSNVETTESIVLMLFQCLVRTLKTQHANGCWGNLGVREETAYAILTLVSLKDLLWSKDFTQEINQAIQRGRDYLLASEQDKVPEQIWIEKTTYGSYFVAEAYITAALSAESRNELVGTHPHLQIDTDEKQMGKYIKLLGMVPLFKGCPKWVIQASWIEGQVYLRMLWKRRDIVFTRKGMTEDKYFSLIPFLWTCVNNLEATFLASKFIFGMMMISFLNFQADEFMEVAIGEECRHELGRVRVGIHSMITRLEKSLGTSEKAASKAQTGILEGTTIEQSAISHHTNEFSTSEMTSNLDPISRAIETLRKFSEFVLSFPEIERASLKSRKRLCRKIEDFLLAHVAQVEASNEFSEQKHGLKSSTGTPVFDEYRQSFQQWLRTISAEHTSCPYSFEFAMCLWENSGGGSFGSVVQQYVAEDLCQHLAIMCRLYNDLGSIKRDKEEWNLNSVNFPEFHDERKEGQDAGGATAEIDPAAASKAESLAKSRLQHVADYERKHLGLAMSELEKTVSMETMDMIRVFVNITDLFGQIYVVKDLASQRTYTADARR